MRLDGKMEVVMVNRYTKFQLNVFNSNEVIQVCKNLKLEFFLFSKYKRGITKNKGDLGLWALIVRWR